MRSHSGLGSVSPIIKSHNKLPTLLSPQKQVDIHSGRVVLSPIIRKGKVGRHMSNGEAVPRHLSCSSLETLKSSSHTPKTLPYPEIEYRISLHILSNWGHPGLVTCSEIDILGEDRVPIQNVNIIAECKLYQNQLLTSLNNKQLMKKSFQDQWSEEWDSNNTPPLILHFDVVSTTPPHFVRIWNSNNLPSANVKDISVMIDNTFIASKEVPKDFGCIISLSTSALPIIAKVEQSILTNNVEINERKSDDYGIVPIQKCRKISFVLFENHCGDNSDFGLNGIELFTDSAEKITKKDIMSIEITDGTGITSPYLLCKNNNQTIHLSDMLQIRSDYTSVPVKVTISLYEKTRIVLARIWNYNAPTKRNIGVKKMKIVLNDHGTVWTGVAKKGKGILWMMNESTTDIWLTEPTPFYQINCK